MCVPVRLVRQASPQNLYLSLHLSTSRLLAWKPPTPARRRLSTCKLVRSIEIAPTLCTHHVSNFRIFKRALSAVLSRAKSLERALELTADS